MRLDAVQIVLVRPSRPANVAAACRAMKNMGIERLWLVDEKPPDVDRETRALAYGAWDVLDGARHSVDLVGAVGGSNFVVGTSGRANPEAWSPRRLAAELPRRSPSGLTSLVFGPEASGLRSDELRLCHERVHVPTSAAQPSLNLAQAVLLLCYELRLASEEASPGPARPAAGRTTAPVAELEAALRDLRGALLEVGYLDPGDPDRLLAEFRRLLARARPSVREIALLRGVARQVGWAGRVARRASGKG